MKKSTDRNEFLSPLLGISFVAVVVCSSLGCSSRANYESSAALASGSHLGTGAAGAMNNKDRMDVQQEILRRQAQEKIRQDREQLEIERQREYDEKLRRYE